MPSPDINPYLDVVLVDKDPQDIFSDALEEMKTRVPEWVPREGNIEVLLLEALSLVVAETVFAINSVPSTVTEALLRMHGIDRDEGLPPQATLRFHMSSTQGFTIPAGVSVRVELDEGLEPVVFTTQVDLDIPFGQDTGDIVATGDRFTSEANGIGSTQGELLDSLIYVEYAEVVSIATNGRDPESDNDYFDRAIQRFGRLSEALVIPSHFVLAVSEYVDVKRALAVDNYDPAVGPPGTNAGHMTVAVYGDGVPVSEETKAIILTNLEASSVANLAVHLIDPTINTIDVSVTVKQLPGFDTVIVSANIEEAIRDYLNPSTWDWDASVRENELIYVVAGVEGVDYVESITPSVTSLTGVAPLVEVNNVTVTVTV